jgi:DNA-directed RNA polymerase subunit RPC12/RpoP
MAAGEPESGVGGRMMDREKVIEGLEVCRDQDNPPGYRFTSCVDDCPYNGNGCARKLKEDAISMLKEQENESKRNPVIVCPHCGKRVK